MSTSCEDGISARVEQMTQEFRPLAQHLVERYYASREHYITAMEQQAAQDRAEVDTAPSDAPAGWRFARLLNAAEKETLARLERAAVRHG